MPEEVSDDVNLDMHNKITAAHLKRQAYLFVRQSTLRQVLENTESTKRQYALREGAVALGWALDRIVVIDSDLGQSGADSDREGFQKLVAAVGLRIPTHSGHLFRSISDTYSDVFGHPLRRSA